MTTACMGGWCTRRDHCAHYHRADRDNPAERLCEPGSDGAYIPITLRPAEPINEQITEDMTLTQQTCRRVLDAVQPKGSTLRQISELSGVHISNVRMAAKLLQADGSIVTMRAGTGEDSKHELWAFTTAEAMEAFEESWLDEVARRQKARQDAKTAKRREQREAEGRSMVAIAAERREARKRAERELEQARREAEAIKLKATQDKLKKQTAAAGATNFKAGTLTPKPKKSAWEDMPVIVPDDLEIEVIESKLQNPYEVKPEDVPPLFSSLRPGQYIAPAPAWVQAVAA